jgi:hypothetical protein
MAGRKQKGSDYARGDPTFEFKVRDPKLEKVAALAPDDEPSTLERYRQFFASYFLAHSNDPAGLNFDNFVKNLRAGAFTMIGTHDVDIFFTSSSAFLVFMEVPDFGYLKEKFPDIDFAGKTSIAEPKNDGNPIALIRLSGIELATILQSAPSNDAIEAELSKQRIQGVRNMLSMCEVEHCEPEFDLKGFSDRIMICQDLDDGSGAKSYFVGLEGDDLAYTISTDPDGALCRLNHHNITYYIKREQFV